MTHDVKISTIGELLCRLEKYGKNQGTFSLTIVLDEAGDYSGMFNFGVESEGSNVVAGSSLGYGKNLENVLRDMVTECRA